MKGPSTEELFCTGCFWTVGGTKLPRSSSELGAGSMMGSALKSWGLQQALWVAGYPCTMLSVTVRCFGSQAT